VSEEQADPSPDGARPVQVRLRRAPKYRAFVVTGAILGFLVGAVTAAVLGDPESRFAPSTVTGYVGAIGLLVGGLLGAILAVLVERPRR
jgi:presenilin-like A22 family membrane protease